MCLRKLSVLLPLLFSFVLLARLSGSESSISEPMQRIKDLLLLNMQERAYIKNLLSEAGIILQTSCGNESEILAIINDLEERLSERDKTIASLKTSLNELEKASSEQKTESEQQSGSSTETVINGWQIASFVEAGIIAVLCFIIYFFKR